MAALFQKLAAPANDHVFPDEFVAYKKNLSQRKTYGQTTPRGEAFLQKLFNMAESAFSSLTVALGLKVGLFDMLGESASEERLIMAEELGRIYGLKPRYVQEFCAAMACARIIEVDPTGKRFWIPEEHKSYISGSSKHHVFVVNEFLANFSQAFNDLVEIFQKDGPLGIDYSKYPGFHDVMGEVSQSWHKKSLIDEYIPFIGMKEKFEEGITVLDVGCGCGFHVFELAKHFPKSHFFGVDIDGPTVKKALREKDARNVKNVDFVEADARAMPVEWNDKFDLVLIFDACHDQQRPDLCLKECQRVVKPSGLFVMCEADSTSNCYRDRVEKPHMNMFYSVSLFHCLPLGCNSPDALCPGTMYSIENFTKLLRDVAKFTQIEVKEIPFFPANISYFCRK